MQKGSHVVDMNYLLRGSLAFTVMFSWMESIPIFFDFVEENKSTDGTGEWEDGVHRPEGVSQTDLFFGLLAGTVREEDVHPSLSPTVVGDWCYLLLTSNCDDFPLEEFAKFVHLLHQCAVYEQSLEDLEPVKPSVLCLRCLLVFLAEQDRLCTRLRSLFTSGPSTADQCETLPEDVLASIHSLFENMSDESDEVCRIGVAVVLCEPYWMHQLVSGGEVSFDSLWGAFVAKESECVSE
ncbi:hypothetical protein AGDE_12795 [Angomonas deanei]|uniref:Uncharacterized protein n=1 Tax=Angomonas deanei TaxID=59799 RepID=A0A7G2CAW2_9TRYP|nr:hypothetical protein AGDE_12795 [Angomonas deanei]CAD2216679.1 hypothetical protein, conserved [Angomonas deanei]|eukprot:EPY23562.1 hypothetical protein AGDE_12795 [Angomonas deanei]